MCVGRARFVGGSPFSYKVAFSLLIAVYSLGWKRTMWAPSKPKKVSEQLYSARCLTMFNSNRFFKKKTETNKRETSQVCRYMWYMSHMLFQFILSCEIIFHYLVGDHLWILYMTASPQVRRVGGCALLISLCLPLPIVACTLFPTLCKQCTTQRRGEMWKNPNVGAMQHVTKWLWNTFTCGGVYAMYVSFLYPPWLPSRKRTAEISCRHVQFYLMFVDREGERSVVSSVVFYVCGLYGM